MVLSFNSFGLALVVSFMRLWHQAVLHIGMVIWKEILIFLLCIFLHLLHLLWGPQGLVIAWLVGRLLLFLQLWMLLFVFAMVDYSVCSWVSLVSVAIDIGISSKNLMLDFRLMGCYLTAFERFYQSMSSTLGTLLCLGAMVLVYFRAVVYIIFLELWALPLHSKFCIVSGFSSKFCIVSGFCSKFCVASGFVSGFVVLHWCVGFCRQYFVGSIVLQPSLVFLRPSF